MRYIQILILAPIFSYATLTPECEIATTNAVIAYLQYTEGNATLTDSYNAVAKMEKICKDK